MIQHFRKKCRHRRKRKCWGPWAGHRVKDHTLEGWCVMRVGKEQRDVRALGQRSIEEPSQFICYPRWNPLCCKIPCSSASAHCPFPCFLYPIYSQIMFGMFLERGSHTLLPCSIPLCAQCHFCVIPGWSNLASKLLCPPLHPPNHTWFTQECNTGQLRNAPLLLCAKMSSFTPQLDQAALLAWTPCWTLPMSPAKSQILTSFNRVPISSFIIVVAIVITLNI